MNLEQLYKLIHEKAHLLKSKKDAKIFFKNQIKFSRLRKSKLKLGAITFDIKQYIYAEIPLFETMEMRYTRQDTTQEDELKLENRLKALGWKWDFYNIGAFIIVAWTFFYFAMRHFEIFLMNTFPTIFLREERFEKVVSFTFKDVFKLSYFFKKNFYLKHTIIIFTNLITDFVLYFRLFF